MIIEIGVMTMKSVTDLVLMILCMYTHTHTYTQHAIQCSVKEGSQVFLKLSFSHVVVLLLEIFMKSFSAVHMSNTKSLQCIEPYNFTLIVGLYLLTLLTDLHCCSK